MILPTNTYGLPKEIQNSYFESLGMSLEGLSEFRKDSLGFPEGDPLGFLGISKRLSRYSLEVSPGILWGVPGVSQRGP